MGDAFHYCVTDTAALVKAPVPLVAKNAPSLALHVSKGAAVDSLQSGYCALVGARDYDASCKGTRFIILCEGFA